ncbi:MAG: ADP-glyceromanno-heptose 6-epimerase, partial [Chlorobiales bacterium]|nr:ADP-glyceromanno-heptose 6-epimerase [Chlorobiales bacterium]
SDFLRLVHENKLPPVEAIIHMGAISATTERDADLLMRNNFEYTRDLALYSIRNSIRYLYASSAATYGDGDQGYSDEDSSTYTLRPLNMYGYSKHLFDLWALREKVTDKMVGLKFFNVFGPNEYHKDDMASVVYKAYNQITEKGSVKLFKSHRPDFADGGQSRDFVYVKDCIEVMYWLLKKPTVNGIFNVGTGKARSFKDLVTATFAAMNKPVNIEYIPMPEHLQGKYQYFTEANMTKLYRSRCPIKFKSLEENVADYVQNHLMKPIQYLESLPSAPAETVTPSIKTEIAL